MTRYGGALLTQLGLLVASLILAEVALQIASRSSRTIERLLAPPWQLNYPIIKDDRLIYRGNPLDPDHDSAGYRNARRPKQADIITLGDSQTYGPADSRAAWPQVLARRTGRALYNMAVVGYSPAQNLLQLDEAFSLAPRLIVVAPYFGNDLYDCFFMAQRHPDLMATVPALLKQAAALRESEGSLRSEIDQRYSMFAGDHPKGSAADRPAAYKRLKLYGLIRRINYQLHGPAEPNPLLSRKFAIAAAAVSPAQHELVNPFDGTDWRTLLTPRYRGRWLDDRDPRIRLGFEVMRNALLTMAERTRARGITLLVVLLPTKESVFWPRVRAPDNYPGLRQLIADESRLRAELEDSLRAHGTDYLDVLDTFRAAPAQPYFEDVDGHPNEVGHHLVALAVAERLAQLLRK